MKKSKISRRHFVGTTALGAGCLALASSSRLFASESASLAPVLKNVWEKSKECIMDSTEAMPDEKYGFKPTKEVFSFSEQLLHLAGANYWFFSTLKGIKPPKAEDAFKSEGKTKSDVAKLMEESFAYGDEVINGLTDTLANEEVTMGKNKAAKWQVILYCVDHITHHRGQIVVYLRLNGIKPPQYRSGFFG